MPLELSLVQQERSEPGWAGIGQRQDYTDGTITSIVILYMGLGPDKEGVQQSDVLEVRSDGHRAAGAVKRR
jgi:hypothetical protein